VIFAAFRAALRKDLRLIRRDRVGLVFLTIAPMIVIAVAGLSLASLYGADPRGATAYVLPVVDEDGGAIGDAIRKGLAGETAVEIRAVADRSAANAVLARRDAGVALVIPAGTSAALEKGESAKLLLLTDPVKYLEVANVRVLVQELRHRIESEARGKAAAELRRMERTAAEARSRIEELRERLGAVKKEIETRRKDAAAEAQAKITEAVRGTERERRAQIEKRLAAELEPVRGFLDELAKSERAFRDWLADVRSRAGKLADKMPPPPEIPAVPPEVSRLATLSAADLVDRLVAGAATPAIVIPTPPVIEVPKLPEVPAIANSDARLPGSLEIDETSVTGAPRRLNTFDQNVPGFSVTFLLLGMLLGVSLALLDEREWGTLERLRAMPSPIAVVLVAKLVSRLIVGFLQMVLLFAVGWLAFGISLGPEPWALLLPTGGIVFAGTAIGLVLAGLTDSREAVLPIGSIVIVTMAAVGGCWWPIDLEPRWMRSVALAFPTTWVMAAYNDLMIRRQAAAAALWPTAVLMAFGSAYLVLGLWLFRRRILRRAGGSGAPASLW